jgi:hypothetical protein
MMAFQHGIASGIAQADQKSDLGIGAAIAPLHAADFELRSKAVTGKYRLEKPATLLDKSNHAVFKALGKGRCPERGKRHQQKAVRQRFSETGSSGIVGIIM